MSREIDAILFYLADYVVDVFVQIKNSVNYDWPWVCVKEAVCVCVCVYVCE